MLLGETAEEMVAGEGGHGVDLEVVAGGLVLAEVEVEEGGASEGGGAAVRAEGRVEDGLEGGPALEFVGFDFVGDEHGPRFGRVGGVAGGVPPDGVEDARVVDGEAVAQFERAERAVEDDGDVALDGVDGEASGFGTREEVCVRDGAEEVVSLGHEAREGDIEAVERGEAVGERDDAIDVREQASGDLGGHALAEGVVVGVGHTRRSLTGRAGRTRKFSHESGILPIRDRRSRSYGRPRTGGRGLHMLQAQRSSGRGDFWLTPVLAMPRSIPILLHGHGMTAALGLVGLSGITVAQLVEAPYLRIGLMLHVALLLAGGLILTTMATRSRRASAAETAGVAHDLRGPLISLQATLELLASDGFGALPEPARTVALRAAATSSRAADLVDRTLERAISRAVTASTTSTADLDVVLREVVDALDVQVRTTGATVAVAPLPRVAGDSCALFRVFVNLLQNGLKYHQPDMPPRIAVAATVTGGWAEIAVSDEGIGIAATERSRVFERHYRTAAGAARATGEGLGLATVRRLVTEMGGTVWVDGAAPRGTTVRVRLPLV